MSGTPEQPRSIGEQTGEPEHMASPGEGAVTDSPNVGRGPVEPVATTEEDEHLDVRHGNDYTAHPDSGFFGAGSNEGEGNDNLERETTPGFQRDKWERGTIMPH